MHDDVAVSDTGTPLSHADSHDHQETCVNSGRPPWTADGAGSPSPVPTEGQLLLPSSAAVGEETRAVLEQAGLRRQLQSDHMAALGTLSAGLAHEINNPLTYVLLNLEHVLRRLRAAGATNDGPLADLAGGTRDDELPGLVQALLHAVEGANRIRRVVGDVLTFAQGNVERRGLVDVRGILESATQLAWHEIPSPRAAVEVPRASPARGGQRS